MRSCHPHFSIPVEPVAAALALAVLVLPAAARGDTGVERSVEAPADGTVEVHNVAGSVEVTAWDRSRVEVTGTLGRGVEELVLESCGRRTVIEVRHVRRTRRDGEAHLELRVPRRSGVRVEAVSASVEIAGLEGRVEAESVSGGVRIEGAPRSVEVETVSGSIEVRATVAALRAESVSGSVRLTGVRGEVEASSVSGRVEIEAEALVRSELEAVSGDLEVEASLGPRAVLEASTHSGDVDLTVPADTSARFRASTYSGRIRNELGPPARRAGRFTPEEELDFTAGHGDAEVTLETFSGDVTLRKR